MKEIVIVMAVFVFAFSGCSKVREAKVRSQKKEQQAPLIEKIDSEELAKLILKPKRAKLDVSRDPFRPLKGAEGYARAFGPGAVHDTTEIQGYQFVGVARLNNDFVAFLKGDKKKGTFRKDDMIKDYTIKDIQEDRIVLSNGVQTVTLKRGDKIQTR
jgi:hypothetical protein